MSRPFSIQHLPLSRPKRGNEEHRLQADLVANLPLILRRGWLFFSVPNKPRSAIQGHQLKLEGMRSGAPDLVFVAPPHGRCYGLELKAGKGRQSEEQKHFALLLDAAGGEYALVRSKDEAIAQLRLWGALRLSEEKAA